MLNVLEFRAAMARKGLTQRDLAKMIGISERAFGCRIKDRKFNSNEIEELMKILGITDPVPIFFSGLVTSEEEE